MDVPGCLVSTSRNTGIFRAPYHPFIAKQTCQLWYHMSLASLTSQLKDAFVCWFLNSLHEIIFLTFYHLIFLSFRQDPPLLQIFMNDWTKTCSCHLCPSCLYRKDSHTLLVFILWVKRSYTSTTHHSSNLMELSISQADHELHNTLWTLKMSLNSVPSLLLSVVLLFNDTLYMAPWGKQKKLFIAVGN